MLDPWMYQRIVDAAPEAIVVADPDGLIRFWNGGAEELFGYAAAEALGASLDLIIPPAQRERHWAGYRRAMQTGTSRYARDLLAVPALRKDGARISVEFHVVLLRDPAGRLAGIAALVRDVTSRWQQERALRQRVQALEAELEQRGASGSTA
jgi:PAS domain S-box-containing protein